MKHKYIIISIVVLSILLFSSLKIRCEPQSETYNVMPGDTLWSIAKEYKPNKMRYDEYIYELQKHNGISANLQTGQAIEVLVWEE